LDPTSSGEDGIDYDHIFNSSAVLDVYLTVDSALLLGMDNETYVIGSFACSGERVESVGIRYKGNSSYKMGGPKKSYKIDFNLFIPGRKWRGIKKLNFNNNWKDPSCMREKVSYDLFRSLGVPGSRTGYANVYMNNTLMGLFTIVQQVDSDFLDEHFGCSDGNLFKKVVRLGDDMDYLGENKENYKAFYELKTNELKDDYSGLIHFLDVLNNTPDLDFGPELEKVFNVDSFIDWLVVNTAVVSLDAYSGSGNNYYLYENPDTGRFEFIPWDLNMAFGNFTWGWTSDEILFLDIYAPYGKAPPVPTLRGVFGLSATEVWAVGDNKTIQHFDGAAWVPQLTAGGSPLSFEALHGTSSTNLFTVARRGAIYRWTGNALLDSGTPDGVCTATSITDSTGFGATGLDDQIVITVSGTGPAVGEKATVTAIAGSVLNFLPPLSAPPVPGQTQFEIRDSWNRMPPATSRDLHSVFAVNASNAFAVGDSGRILRFNGTKWTAMTSGPGTVLRSVWGADLGNLFCVGNNGTILRFTGFGVLYSGTPTGTCTPATIVDSLGFGGAQPGDEVVITDGGGGPNTGEKTCILSVNGATITFGPLLSAAPAPGTTQYIIRKGWNPMVSPVSVRLYGIHGLSGSEVYAVGAGGTILNFNGSVWSVMSSPTSKDLHAVFAISSSLIYAVGEGGTILTFNGVSWTDETPPTTENLTGVWADSSLDVFFTGASGTILHFSGSTWTVMDSGIPPPPAPDMVLIKRILDVAAYRQTYELRMAAFLQTTFTQPGMDGRIDGFYNLIKADVYADTLEQFTNQEFEDSLVSDIPPVGNQRILGLKPFIAARKTSMQGQLP
jgi:hypothetical protein